MEIGSIYTYLPQCRPTLNFICEKLNYPLRTLFGTKILGILKIRWSKNQNTTNLVGYCGRKLENIENQEISLYGGYTKKRNIFFLRGVVRSDWESEIPDYCWFCRELKGRNFQNVENQEVPLYKGYTKNWNIFWDVSLRNEDHKKWNYTRFWKKIKYRISEGTYI